MYSDMVRTTRRKTSRCLAKLPLVKTKLNHSFSDGSLLTGVNQNAAASAGPIDLKKSFFQMSTATSSNWAGSTVCQRSCMNTSSFVIEGTVTVAERDSYKSKSNSFKVQWVIKHIGAPAVVDAKRLQRRSALRLARASSGFDPADDNLVN